MSKQYLRFRLGHEWYGMEVESVLEVLHFLALNELPVTRPDILGLMRVRESVIPVTDLRVHFELPASYHLTTPIIVAKTPQGLIGLVVDDVDTLERIEESQIIPHEAGASRYVTGVATLPDCLLLLLNIEQLYTEIPTAQV